jgi:hypothetical protein
MARRWVLLATLLGLAVFASGPAQAKTPRCFGAAARDPLKPCTNAKLNRSVTPTPRRAPLIPGSDCAKLAPQGSAVPCAFGPDAASARGHFALIGDSHAAHWRSAVTLIARRAHWRGVALTLSGCSFSTIARTLPEPYASECETWKSDVLAWLAAHPEVTSLVLANKTPDQDDFAPRPMPSFEAQANAYVEMWNRLPASVRRVYVIRDNPSGRVTTLTCVARMMARKRSAARHCSVPLRTALRPDPQAEAVMLAATPRIALVDLTPFFCDARSCYPVVGGVLVYRDINHLTTLFAETLAPFLQRALALP